MKKHMLAAWRNLQISRRRIRLASRLTHCGANLTVLGNLILVNEGTINFGDNLTIRSFPYQMVQIRVSRGAELTIGHNTFINQGVRISCSYRVTIGNDCLIGDEALIFDQDWHAVGSQPVKKAAVTIGAKVWIAARAIILRDVEIGEGAVIGAGAVVTRSIPPYVLAAGIPARPIRDLKVNDALS
jgi:maltose O-acetyltransferase